MALAKGTGQLGVGIDAALLERLREFVKGRGETVRQAVEAALVRHMDNPPPLAPPPKPVYPPLPPVTVPAAERPMSRAASVVRGIREEYGQTAAQLAAEAGLTEAQVTEIEGGREATLAEALALGELIGNAYAMLSEQETAALSAAREQRKKAAKKKKK